MFWSFPRWFAPSVDGNVLLDSPENVLIQGKFAKVPFIVGQTKDEGAFFYRLTLNAFNNGQYDDNFVDNKLPRILPVISDFNSKLYPLTRQVNITAQRTLSSCYRRACSCRQQRAGQP